MNFLTDPALLAVAFCTHASGAWLGQLLLSQCVFSTFQVTLCFVLETLASSFWDPSGAFSSRIPFLQTSLSARPFFGIIVYIYFIFVFACLFVYVFT